MTFFVIISYIYFAILLASFLITLPIYNYKHADLYLKLFPPFLLLTLIIEVAGHVLHVSNLPNMWLFNLFTPIEFIYYFYILLQLIDNRIIRKIIKVSIFVYPVIAFLNIFLIQGFQYIHTYTIHLGALLIVIFCGTYFIEVMMKDALSSSLGQPAFWICAGLLFFYTVYAPLVAAMNIRAALPIFNTNIIVAVQMLPNYILYGLFAMGFIRFYRCSRIPTEALS